MVQQFVDDIVDKWEMKLIFLDRIFSHAMVKSPSHDANDGLDENLGVGSAFSRKRKTTTVPCVPGADVIERASEVLDSIEGRVVYARVDVVLSDLRNVDERNVLYLMEIELIEPYLFLDRKSGEVLGKLILDRMGEAKTGGCAPRRESSML